MDEIHEQRFSGDTHQETIEEEINLLDYLLVIHKYRRMILLICCTAVATTAIISLLLPDVYAATASVVPPIETMQEQSELANSLGTGKSSLLSKVIDVTSIADMYAGILKSRAVVDPIIDRFDLMRVYEAKYRSSAREELQDSTGIDVSEEGIVSVTVEDRDPNRAAAMANAYVQGLDRQNKRLSSGQATSKRVFLESRLQEIEQELSNIENIPAKQAQIKEMLYELLSRECELARIEEARSMPTIQVLDEATVPEKKCKPKRWLIVMLSGVTALFGSVFLAFAREYVAKIKQREVEEKWAVPSGRAQPGEQEGDFDVLEEKRSLVSAQRKRPKRENGAYTRQV